MARKARLEFPGAIYHVLDRGDRCEAIYRDDADRSAFLETLTEACERTGWRLHAHVLLARGSEALGLRADDLGPLPKRDDRKAALAAVLRARTTVSNAWTAEALSMGHASRVTHSIEMPLIHPVRRKLETVLDR